MKIQHLIRILEAYHPLSLEFQRTLKRESTLLSLPRNHELIKAPAIATHIYFIVRGLAEMYTYQNGEKRVHGFFKAGQIVIDLKSFLYQGSSQYTIKLLEKCEIICISFDQAFRYLKRFHEAVFIFSGVIVTEIEFLQNKQEELRTLSAGRRLHKLISMYPRIEQRASQESIASYIGIAPQSLSKLKRKRAKKIAVVKRKSEP